MIFLLLLFPPSSLIGQEYSSQAFSLINTLLKGLIFWSPLSHMGFLIYLSVRDQFNLPEMFTQLVCISISVCFDN